MNKEFNIEEIDDEIDLKIIFSIFLRNKRFIIIFTFISILLSSILNFSTKPTWQGVFNIIINEKHISKNKINRFLVDVTVGLEKARKKQKILSLSSSLKNKISLIQNLDKLKNYKNIILFAEIGKIKLNNLKIINNYLLLYKEKINGFLILVFNCDFLIIN